MSERGRLRVYLGAAPGVGKTVAMLDEARRRLERGTDLVVGLVETHERPWTANAARGLPTLERIACERGGEFDLDGALERAPRVVVVDELAHTNLAYTRRDGRAANAKRWQDVHELLSAGIDVITTVNVQHLESLNDVAAAITGVRQRETVPDVVVRAADEVELVDMSPRSLRRRLAHGNVYPRERVDAALGQYFREGNLAALRELSLLWLADRVDESMEKYRGEHRIASSWPTRERVLAAITGGAESPGLMRRAALIASRRSGGEWSAVLVTRRDGLAGVRPERLEELRSLALDLGGTLHVVLGDDPAQAVLAFATAENATQILVGVSRRGRIARLLQPGVGEDIIAGSGEIDTHVVAQPGGASAASHPRRRATGLSRGRRVLGYLLAILAPALATAALAPVHSPESLPLEASIALAVVVAVALVGGLAPALIAAVVSAALLNWFFTPPTNTLTIADPRNAASLAVFAAVGIAVATVVDRVARRSLEARRARAEADALTAVAHGLIHAGIDLDQVLAAAAELVGARGAAVLGPGGAVLAATGEAPPDAAAADLSIDVDETTTLALRGGDLDAEDRALLRAYAARVAVALERRAAADTAREKDRLSEAERGRTALLAAVSHDLRSPIAAVKAATAALRDPAARLDEEDRAALLEGVATSADRLDALVANLLDMSRISTGAVPVRPDEVDLTEVAARALAPLPGNERIAVRLGDLAVSGDAALLERVLANLAENALRYAPPPASITLDARLGGPGRVLVRVVDTGRGVAPENQTSMFRPFQRVGDVPAGSGVGLGLAVAQGLTEAMGGTLGAEDTPGGGLTFVIDLPAAGAPGPEEVDP